MHVVLEFYKGTFHEKNAGDLEIEHESISYIIWGHKKIIVTVQCTAVICSGTAPLGLKWTSARRTPAGCWSTALSPVSSARDQTTKVLRRVQSCV
jgi:hypothetical protein